MNQTGKQHMDTEVVNELDNDSLEEGVVSSSESTSDTESLYQTVEKRQVKVLPQLSAAVKSLSAEEFLKAGQRVADQNIKAKKKKGKGRKQKY